MGLTCLTGSTVAGFVGGPWGIINARSDAAGIVAVPEGDGSYPGGKSGAGIYQRLINLIPPHRVMISAFAGHCGIARKIKPAEHTIVIDADAKVCQRWDDWRRSAKGRNLEIHHCDSIQSIKHRFGVTEYCTGFCRGAAGSLESATAAAVEKSNVGRLPQNQTTLEAIVFCDAPYVLSHRSHGDRFAGDQRRSDQFTGWGVVHLRFRI